MMNAETALAFLGQWRFYVVLAESAGLFWIFAELAILFGVRMGRSRLEQSPLPRRIALTRGERRRALVQLTLLGVAGAFILGRHYIGPLAFPSVEDGEPAAVAARFIQCIHVHQALWAVFTTGWVALECAIVWHGFLGYRMLRRRIHAASGRRAGGGGACAMGLILLLLAGVACARAASAEPLHDALRAAVAGDGAYWNALYLYLRLAGVVWIAVEWVAALVVWRAWRLLRAPRAEGGA